MTSNIFHVTVSHHNFNLFTIFADRGFSLKNTFHCQFYMYFLYFLVLNMNNFLLLLLFQGTGHEDGDDADQLRNEDTNSEIEIDDKKKEWACALAKRKLVR